MRLFLAIELDDALRAGVEAMQARLKKSDPGGIRWDNPNNFHLTIKFIGDQPETALEGLMAVCADVAAGTEAFTLTLRGAGAFPKRGPVRTLWAGVSGGADRWKELALRAQEPLAAFGVAREGGLAPHITLGRVKTRPGERRDEGESEALRAALASETDTECGTQVVDRITLVQSTLDPRGAIHTPLREWPLGRKLDKEQQRG